MVTRTTDIKYLDLGVKHFCIGTDVGVLYKCAQQRAAAGPAASPRSRWARPPRGLPN
eukprot:SAG11_NODE_5690_length_1486_cov_1.321557_2_plen_57_part_00